LSRTAIDPLLTFRRTVLGLSWLSSHSGRRGMEIHKASDGWRTVAFAAIAGIVVVAATRGPARADQPASAVEALMAEYTRLWSAKDAHAIWTKVYRLDPGQTFRSEADLSAGFARLEAQGYDHSDLLSVRGCLLTPKVALAVLRFRRLKSDGAPLVARDLASAYLLRKFEDGWRVTTLLPFSSSARLDCTSASEP